MDVCRAGEEWFSMHIDVVRTVMKDVSQASVVSHVGDTDFL